MDSMKKGTPQFGFILGCLFVLAGALLLWIGFWKTLFLAVLFAFGYFLGSVEDKSGFFRKAVGKVVPEKKEETINFRAEMEKRQQEAMQRGENRPESDHGLESDQDDRSSSK